MSDRCAQSVLCADRIVGGCVVQLLTGAGRHRVHQLLNAFRFLRSVVLILRYIQLLAKLWTRTGQRSKNRRAKKTQCRELGLLAAASL